MATDSFFSLACVSMIALLFGSVMTFSGYRLFMFLIPIWGFFFGFVLGAQAIQAIFGTAFLADVTSWVVGFVVAVVFAALSYLFYFFAVALIGGSLGYTLGVGVMLALLPNLTFVAWVVGVVVGLIVAVTVTVLNIQKLVIVIATALLGAAVIIGTFLLLLGQLPSSDVMTNPVRAVLETSPFWTIVFIIIAALGMTAQYTTSRRSEIKSYNRWEEIYVTEG